MGGGGANSLDSPKTADNGDFERDETDADSNNNDLDKDSKEEDIISEYTYKTYDDYFTDLNIAAETILEQDLTGSGSVSDPYIVHSTRGFLWLTNYKKSGLSLTNKYIELACDVVLNDEIFDQEGNPTGGDGTIYLWEDDGLNSAFYLEGNDFEISGVYRNEENTGVVYFFYSIRKIENTKFKNIFLLGKENVALFFTLKNISNCIIKDSTIIGTEEGGYCGVFAYSLDIEARNCENYANVFSHSIAGGIAGYTGGNIFNCKNYGYIKGKFAVGGIVGLSQISKISNCVNYGTIDAILYFSAGIVGQVNNKTVINQCYNYGEILVSEYRSGACGGIAGTIKTSVSVLNCNNYAKVYCEATTQAEIIGYFSPKSSYEDMTVVIFCCYGFGKNSNFLGAFHVMEYPNCEITVENCYFYSNSTNSYLIGGNGNTKVNYNINNLFVEFYGNKFYIASGYCQTKVNITNILIEGQSDDIVLSSTVEFKIGTIIRCAKSTKGQVNNLFYGSDFSGFYVDFKTGEIGLKALSGKGFYQGNVTEEILISKGFEKKLL